MRLHTMIWVLLATSALLGCAHLEAGPPAVTAGAPPGSATASPVSPLGQDTFIKTVYATSVALPSTLINDPNRNRLPVNEERPIAAYHGYAFVTDLEEGLIVVDVATLLDGNPANNYIKRAATYNPEGRLNGARHAWMAGQWLYITTAQGLAVVDASNPKSPAFVGGYSGKALRGARQSTVQWQYCFVTDEEGVKVFDISNPAKPVPISGASVSLGNAEGLYAARTYLYVADGSKGLAIIDIKNPEKAHLINHFTADGQLNDVRDVQIGSVSASMYALLADGHNGMRVVQMISPENVPGHMGFSPEPKPRLIATYPTEGAAVSISRGLDRDRVVDESGKQTVVFGRRGSGPLSIDEMKAFYRHSDPETQGTYNGPIYKVSDVKHGEKNPREDEKNQAEKDTLPVEKDAPMDKRSLIDTFKDRKLEPTDPATATTDKKPTFKFKIPKSAERQGQESQEFKGPVKQRREPVGLNR